MPFYFRKSINLGLIRFNLSKSGIGISTGIKGLRLSTGPRGTYIHIGRGGLYYRQAIIERPRSLNSKRVSSEPNERFDQTVAEMKSITSGCLSRMIDSKSIDLLNEINARQQKLSLSHVAIFLGIMGTLTSFGLQAPGLALGIVVVTSLAGIYFSTCIDELRRTTVIMYDLDEESQDAYKTFCATMDRLSDTNSIWLVDSEGEVLDGRYHAGAGKLVSKSLVTFICDTPNWLRTNVPCFGLKSKQVALYFLPDLILIHRLGKFGSIRYKELSVEHTTTRFIEDGLVPGDAKVIDRTWRYVNNNGSPDRRFKNNSELPICLYEQIDTSSTSGLQIRLMSSRLGFGKVLNEAIETQKQVIETASAAERIRTEDETKRMSKLAIKQRRDQSESGISALVVFETLCCLMCVDGKITGEAKNCLFELMQENDAKYWTREQFEFELDIFVTESKSMGYRQKVAATLKSLNLQRKSINANKLLESLDELTKADSKVTEREASLLALIRDSLFGLSGNPE